MLPANACCGLSQLSFMAVVPFSSQVSKGRMDLAVTAGLADTWGS